MASVSTSVPSLTWGTDGITIPDDQSILDGALADLDTAFGGGLNITNLSTPQGQIASSLTAIVSEKNAEIAHIVNQVDPQYADGRFQDAIARIYYLTRKEATATSVTATVTGTVGVTLPAGTLAQDTSGNTYASTEAATIGTGGVVDIEFQNQETGPIACPAGTLTVVYQTIPGWDAITNAAAGAIGSNQESRADFEFRRANSVAANGNGSKEAVRAAVAAVDNVTDIYVIDNPTGSTVTSGSTNYSLLPHSIYVAVVGGESTAIANAMLNKLSAGCDMNGNTTVTVQDSVNYSAPYPSYVYKFNRPTAVAIKFAVTILTNPLLPSNVTELIKSAIIARFNGTDGSTKQRIAANVLAGSYYAPVASVSSYVSVSSILIGTTTATGTIVQIGIDQYPTISSADITVSIV
jgi:uncharacterized phage protein gp47/JayE